MADDTGVWVKVFPDDFNIDGGSAGSAVIKSATVTPDTTSVPGFAIYKFTASGEIVVEDDGAGVADVLVVGAGGSGGYSQQSFTQSGGGGAGGFVEMTTMLPAGTINITVGGGGNQGPGTPSAFGSITAGGGGDGGWGTADARLSSGKDGASGGGSGSPSPALSGKANLLTQGNDGGLSSGLRNASGGGGANGPGAPQVAGIGKQSTITGTPVTYCTGGGVSVQQHPVDPPGNTGDGGVGVAIDMWTGPGGKGSSGIVIVKVAI